mmetsp:Transcript_29343/g.94104  ORF Transcript_29343/g.94104 Transcript_29343/m.94104 type:complete len:665 (-) Transcript_29343:1119-3113(-)
MTPETIVERLRQSPKKPQVVFVSACHSGSVAQAFVEAGVKYVIAVKKECEVRDKAARQFAQTFYGCLLRGHSVRDAHRAAQNRVRDEANGDVEAAKFELFTEASKEDEPIFASEERGTLELMNAPVQPSVAVKSSPFLGRSLEIQEVYNHIINSEVRTIVVTGPLGIGKSQVALRAVRYAEERRQIHHAVHIVLSDFFYERDHVTAFAKAFGVSPEGADDVQPVVERIVRKFRQEMGPHGVHEHLALILDDCDRWARLRSGDFLPFLRCLQGLDRVKIIVTAQQRIELEPIKIVQVGALKWSDAADLFRKLVPRDLSNEEMLDGKDQLCDGNYRWAWENHPVVQETDGNPKVIEKVAHLCADLNLLYEKDIILNKAREVKGELLGGGGLSGTRAPTSSFSDPFNVPTAPLDSPFSPIGTPSSRIRHHTPAPASTAPTPPIRSKDVYRDLWAQAEDAIRGGWDWGGFSQLVKAQFDEQLSGAAAAAAPDTAVHYQSFDSAGNEFRTLTEANLEFLRESPSIWRPGRPALDRPNVQHFYDWFVRLLDILRLNIHLWNQRTANGSRVIMGLRNRQQAANALQGCEQGCFLLRLSESLNGNFVVCYITREGNCKQVPVEILPTGEAVANTETQRYPSLSALILDKPDFTLLHCGAGATVPKEGIFVNS